MDWLSREPAAGAEGSSFPVISYKVDDLDRALSELKEKGQKLIDDKPRALFGNRYAFVQRPDQLCGILTELLDGDFDKSLVPPIRK